MKKVYVFLAEGFEVVEALTPVDILRRGGCEVYTVSITGNRQVISSHKVPVIADKLFEEVNCGDADMLVLPGGMPGTTNLNNHKALKEALKVKYEKKGWVTAICAAPMILGQLGLLKGRKATCYPGHEPDLLGATFTGNTVEIDENVITARGAGVSLQFGLALLTALEGRAKAAEIKDKMRAE
jgi:4-methyl-5(b-hydroxyethyl)-thiazole monophosphate biosynthesis